MHREVCWIQVIHALGQEANGSLKLLILRSMQSSKLLGDYRSLVVMYKRERCLKLIKRRFRNVKGV